MEELTKLVDDKIQNSIDEFIRRRKKMFTVVRLFKYPLIILTSVSTIVLGLELGNDCLIVQKNIALVVGTIVTALTTLMTFWNVEEYWLRNKIIEIQLIKLQDNFQFEKKMGLTEDRIKFYFNQYQDIINEYEKIWKSTVSQNNEK